METTIADQMAEPGVRRSAAQLWSIARNARIARTAVGVARGSAGAEALRTIRSSLGTPHEVSRVISV